MEEEMSKKKRTHVTQTTDCQYEQQGEERDTPLRRVTQNLWSLTIDRERMDGTSRDIDEGVTAGGGGGNDDGAESQA